MNSRKSISYRMSRFVALSLVIAMTLTAALAEFMFLTLKNEAQAALIGQAIDAGQLYASGQRQVVEARIENYVSYVESAAEYASYLLSNPGAVSEGTVKHISEWEKDGVEEGSTTFYYLTFEEGEENSPAVLEELGTLAALEPMFAIVREDCPVFIGLFAYTVTGVSIAYDDIIENKFGASCFSPEGNLYYDRPAENGETYISDVYEDAFGRGRVITISAPILVDGVFRGVIEADALIDNISELIEGGESFVEGSYKALLSSEKELICTNTGPADDTLSGLFGSDSASYVDAMYEQEAGILETVKDGGRSVDVYVVYETVARTGWRLAVTLPEEGIVEPANTFAEIIQRANFVMITLCIVLLLGCFVLAGYFCRKMLKPLQILTEEVEKIDGENMEYVSDLQTGDEIEALSKKFEAMVRKVTDYMQSLTRVTAEKERISTELDVATNIQKSMLPCIFPAFPDRSEFEIYATMDPAKEVGGDFYDFFMVDESHLAVVVADVSGKGVPAALFMVIGKTLIKDHTVPGEDLGSVFSKVNNILCEANSEGLFITAFEGVLDLKTGEMLFVNAGHEMPYIYRKSEGYVPQKIRAGFVLAGMEGMRYRAGSFRLEIGDRLFQYTDGVTEATDAHNQLFGQDRLTETLNKNRDLRPTELLPKVKEAIDQFVGEAPQFDDITMLGLEFRAKME